MSTGEIRIYSTPGCGWAIRNYAALIEKGVPFTIIMAKGADGCKTEDFLALSPYARTPVLSLNGEAVWDSLYMNYFIDELYPEPALMPESPAERARARLWMRHCEHEIFPSITGLKGAPTEETGERVQAGLLKLIECGFLEDHPGDFWMGSRISLVDMCYATLFDSLEAISTMSGPGWIEIPDRLLSWRDAIFRYPAMRQARAIPDNLSLDRASLTVFPEAGERIASSR